MKERKKKKQQQLSETDGDDVRVGSPNGMCENETKKVEQKEKESITYEMYSNSSISFWYSDSSVPFELMNVLVTFK